MDFTSASLVLTNSSSVATFAPAAPARSSKYPPRSSTVRGTGRPGGGSAPPLRLVRSMAYPLVDAPLHCSTLLELLSLGPRSVYLVQALPQIVGLWVPSYGQHGLRRIDGEDLVGDRHLGALGLCLGFFEGLDILRDCLALGVIFLHFVREIQNCDLMVTETNFLEFIQHRFGINVRKYVRSPFKSNKSQTRWTTFKINKPFLRSAV